MSTKRQNTSAKLKILHTLANRLVKAENKVSKSGVVHKRAKPLSRK